MTDVYYNVWNTARNTWVERLWGYDDYYLENATKPVAMFYFDARLVLEKHARIQDALPQQYQVRILNADGTPGEVVGYNVWYARANRWTNSSGLTPDGTVQDTSNPYPVTLEVATSRCKSLGVEIFEVKMIGADKMPRDVEATSTMAPVPINASLTPTPTPMPEESPFDFDKYYGIKR